MRKSLEALSTGVLVLLANAGVVIPYFFCLMLYNQNKSDSVYALPFLMLYTFRCIGMLLTAHLKYPATTMLNVSSAFGVLGSLLMLFSEYSLFGVLGGILLGLSSSWIWPYFLTIRSRGKLADQYSLGRDSNLSSLIALIVLLIVSYYASLSQAINLAFGVLAIFYVLAWLGGIYIKREIDFYQVSDFKLSRPKANRVILNLVYLTILVILIFMIRYSRLTTTSHVIDLLMCLLAAIILGILLYYQLEIHKRIFPLSLGAFNRGVVMNFLLLYSAFDSSLRFKSNTTAMIFIVYIVGFEAGPILLKKIIEWRYPLLIIGLLLTLFNFVPLYFLGLFFCAIFVGSDNVILNQSLYSHPNLDGERAFLIKYQLSSIGNISQQLLYMTFIYILSYSFNLNVLSFFNAQSQGASFKLLTMMHTVITLWIVIFASVTYYFVHKNGEIQTTK